MAKEQSFWEDLGAICLLAFFGLGLFVYLAIGEEAENVALFFLPIIAIIVGFMRNVDFIQVVPLDHPDAVEDYLDPLSRRDAEVIVLAKEREADLILTRDTRLRRCARHAGLHAIHTLTFLIEAKRAGFLQAVKPLLDEMRTKEVLIREGVYTETLRQAGELPRRGKPGGRRAT